MQTNRRYTIVIFLLVVVLAVSLFYNGIQSTAEARLRYQNRSLERDIESLRETARQKLYPAPASPVDIKIGQSALAIPHELHKRQIQIIPYDRQLTDSGWLVIDLPFGLISQIPHLDITLFYRDQNGEKDHERAIYLIQSAKDCFNLDKQRLEIPVPQHLSSLCRLRLLHENGTSWSFSIEDSKLIWKLEE